MKDILTAPFLTEMCRMTANMYRLGWDEANGGNISYLLQEKEVSGYVDTNRILRSFPITFDASPLEGKLFLVTGTGKYFKNVADDPAVNLGIVKVADDGQSVGLLWGYEDGGAPTSELSSHFMSHIKRLERDPNHRVVTHTHPVNLIAMTFVHSLDEGEFTRTLWRMVTECMVIFPDGIGVMPWMICGTDEIGRETAKKMEEFRLAVWAHHGIFGTGNSLDAAFGLIETVEKAAEIYLKITHLPIKQEITDSQLWEIADRFAVSPNSRFLSR